MNITSRTALVVATAGWASLTMATSPAFPAALRGGDSVATSYSCTVSTPKGTLSFSGPVTFTGTTPANVAVGTTVSITGFQASVSVPGSVLNEAYSYGVRTISASVAAFDITASDADVPNVDIANKTVNVGHMSLGSSNPSLNARIPRKPAKVGVWVANQGGTMVFSPGDATFRFKTNLGSLNVPCSPGTPVPPISTTTVG
jgi:hypothetical protein